MSAERRHENPGRRERAARRRHRRGECFAVIDGTVIGPHKLGRKKMGRWNPLKSSSESRSPHTLAVAESEQRPNGESEPNVYRQSGSGAPPTNL